MGELVQNQTTNATRVLIRRDGKTQSTWTLIPDGANTLAVKDDNPWSRQRVRQQGSGPLTDAVAQVLQTVLPVSWRGNDLVIGSVVYRVVARLLDGAYVVEAT